MAEDIENLVNISPDWANKDLEKVLPRPWIVTLNRRKKEKQVSVFFFVSVSVKVEKFKIKRLFSVYFNSLPYKTNRFHVAVPLFTNRSQRMSKSDKNISDRLGCTLCVKYMCVNIYIYGKSVFRYFPGIVLTTQE